MNRKPARIIYLMFTAAVLIYALVLIPFPQVSYSAQLYHTISISSFPDIGPAEEQFDSLAKKFSPRELAFLRIEKIGKFYCVRLGKFEDQASADELYAALKDELPGSTIMKAYIKDERIVKIYSDDSSGGSTEKQVEPEQRPQPEPGQQLIARGVDKPEKAETFEQNLAKIPGLVQAKNYEAASGILKSEIAVHPEHPELNAWLGMVYLKMDRPSDALQYLEKAARLSPDVPDYHNSLGYSLLLLDRFDQAINEFNSAIMLDPGYYDSLTGLCMSYAKKGEKAEAMKIYNKIKGHDKQTSDKLLKIIDQ